MPFSGQGMGRRCWMWAPVSARSASSSWPRVLSGCRWWVRAALACQTFARALLRNPFRGFVHPARGLEAVLERHGFVRIQRRETLKWSADLYERADAARSRDIAGGFVLLAL